MIISLYLKADGLPKRTFLKQHQQVLRDLDECIVAYSVLFLSAW